MNAEVKTESDTNKKSVVQDIPVTFHDIYFVPIKKTNQKLSGDPKILLKFEDVLSLIQDYDYSAVELSVKDRYTYNIASIQINKKGIYECVINCNDSQAEDIWKRNKKQNKTEVVSFDKDESHLIRCHVLFRTTDEKKGVVARMLIEGNRKVSEQTVRRLIQKILSEIDEKNIQPDFFEEDYAGAVPTKNNHYKMAFSVKVKTTALLDQGFLEQLTSGDFYHIDIIEKSVGKVHGEVPFLREEIQSIKFKPYFESKTTLSNIFDGVKKLAKKKFGIVQSKGDRDITYKICYPEGAHKRTISFDPIDEAGQSFTTKKLWINKFERKNSLPTMIFDSDLCRRMSKLFDEQERNDDAEDDI